MGYVRMENHYYPEGQTFDMPALGQVVNFQEVKVSDLQVAEYKALGFEWPDNDMLVITVKDPEAAETEEAEFDYTAGRASLEHWDNLVASEESGGDVETNIPPPPEPSVEPEEEEEPADESTGGEGQ